MTRLHLFLLLMVIVSALSVVTSQNKARKLFAELQKENSHAQQMEEEWGRLRIEERTSSNPAQVEKIAVSKLKMQLPKGQQIQFIHAEELGVSLPQP
ncbi:MAG: cell division protein FtsL [Candidatus Nitrotoga sp.]